MSTINSKPTRTIKPQHTPDFSAFQTGKTQCTADLHRVGKTVAAINHRVDRTHRMTIHLHVTLIPEVATADLGIAQEEAAEVMVEVEATVRVAKEIARVMAPMGTEIQEEVVEWEVWVQN